MKKNAAMEREEKRGRRWVKYAVTTVVCGGMVVAGELCDIQKLFFTGLILLITLNLVWLVADWAKDHKGNGFV